MAFEKEKIRDEERSFFRLPETTSVRFLRNEKETALGVTRLVVECNFAETVANRTCNVGQKEGKTFAVCAVFVSENVAWSLFPLAGTR